jgi:hypothetical protein
MRPKLTLKDLTFKLKEVPQPAPPPPRPPSLGTDPQEAHPGPPRPEMPKAVWCEMGKQWLRVVIDNRIGVGRRIFRIELYDTTREKRLAIFRRQTEAMRQ